MTQRDDDGYDAGRAALTKSLVMAELAVHVPRTQQQGCALAARVDLTVFGPPESDYELLVRSAAVAKGLFGPAFETGSEAQRIAWIDMCEAAMRAAMRP